MNMRTNQKGTVVLALFLSGMSGMVLAEERKPMELSLRMNEFCPTSSQNNEIKTLSKIFCAMMCLHEKNCYGFCHNDDDYLCRTFSMRSGEAEITAIPAAGFKMFWTHAAYGLPRLGYKAYFHVNIYVTRDEAVTGCEAKGAVLTMPMNLEENNFIASQAPGSNIWIYSYENPPRKYYHPPTNQALTYFNWMDDKPNGNEDQLCIIIADSTTWDDKACSDSYTYVCEIEITE